MLRIYGNRALRTLPGLDTRPTSARVREALFNIWQSRVADSRWLDLCTGSGAIGAEALCRGAAEVVGIEKSPEAYAITRENWQKVAQSDQTFSLFRGDVVKQLSRLHRQPFDCIYFDPPYDSELYLPVLERVVSLRLLQPTGEIAVEYRPDAWAAIAVPGLELVRQKQYGITHLAFYTPESPVPSALVPS